MAIKMCPEGFTYRKCSGSSLFVWEELG